MINNPYFTLACQYYSIYINQIQKRLRSYKSLKGVTGCIYLCTVTKPERIIGLSSYLFLVFFQIDAISTHLHASNNKLAATSTIQQRKPGNIHKISQ